MIKDIKITAYGRVAAFLLLGLGLGACMRAVPPEAIPPRLLFYEPNQVDTLSMGENDFQYFALRAQAGEDAVYSAYLQDQPQEIVGGGFTFRPPEHSLVWPHLRRDSLVVVTLSVEDSGQKLEQQWPVWVGVTPGLEIITEPEELDLTITMRESILFKIGVRNMAPPYHFSYRLNGTSMGSDSTYLFVPRYVGDFEVYGHAWKGGVFNVERFWNVTVTCDDIIPPPPPTDLRVGPGDAPGDLVVAFTPPVGEDELQRYEVRAWHQPLDPDQWGSTDLVGLVDPDNGTAEERFTLSGLDVGSYVFVRVQAYDFCGNPSVWSGLAEGKVSGHAVTGMVMDWETGAGIPDLEVRYGIGDPEDEVVVFTDALGEFHCSNVPAMGQSQSNPPGKIRDENTDDTGEWYDIRDYRAIDDSLHYHHGTFGAEPTETGVYPEYLDYFHQMLSLEQWNDFVLRARYPIAVHVVPFVYNGVDYEQMLRNAMTIWEEDCGLDLFTETADEEQAELYIRYYPGQSGSGFYELLEREAGTDIPLRARIHWMANGQPGAEQTIQRVILHELGHALGVSDHSYEIGHVMATTNVSDRLSDDEIKLIRILYHMNAREDLSLIIGE